MGTFTAELNFGPYAYGTMAETPGITYKTTQPLFGPLDGLYAGGVPGLSNDF